MYHRRFRPPGRRKGKFTGQGENADGGRGAGVMPEPELGKRANGQDFLETSLFGWYDSAVTDSRQLRGHQERRSRAEVTTGQRVTGMLTGMSWAAATGASHHQQDNNKHQAGPRGAVTVDNRPGTLSDPEEEVEEEDGGL
ncbi:hypothetical protein GBF38_001081 [Nibea albiflora]|uniref:Uncharacterized protein n=1 Tax=Nibea albiflora TaxID=240163 RepID=A0ACB7EX93_NIBAL|nr:hypothetical protein GBF38_001081 [Nibea albiflora]